MKDGVFPWRKPDGVHSLAKQWAPFDEATLPVQYALQALAGTAAFAAHVRTVPELCDDVVSLLFLSMGGVRMIACPTATTPFRTVLFGQPSTYCWWAPPTAMMTSLPWLREGRNVIHQGRLPTPSSRTPHQSHVSRRQGRVLDHKARPGQRRRKPECVTSLDAVDRATTSACVCSRSNRAAVAACATDRPFSLSSHLLSC